MSSDFHHSDLSFLLMQGSEISPQLSAGLSVPSFARGLPGGWSMEWGAVCAAPQLAADDDEDEDFDDDEDDFDDDEDDDDYDDDDDDFDDDDEDFDDDDDEDDFDDDDDE